MKIRLSLIIISSLLSLPSSGEEVSCRVEWAYKEGKNTNGIYPGGMAQPMTGWADFTIYKKCKEFCFAKNSNNYPHISKVSGCYINESPIENSKYKVIYNKNMNNICHIAAYKNGKKYGGDYLDLTQNEILCQQSMATKYWCQQGYKCEFTFGKW